MKKYITFALCFILGISCTVLCMQSYPKIKKNLRKKSYTEKLARNLFSKWDKKNLFLDFDSAGLENSSGETLEDFLSQNETAIIYFWATWCPWCRKATDLNESILQKGIPMVALPFDSDKDYFEYYMIKHEVGYKNIFSVDSDGTANFLERKNEFDIPSIPSWWLLKNGEISKIFIGDKGKEEIKKLLEN